MSETSFPLLEQPLTDYQWKSIAKGFGTGILDEGGNPYNLVNLNNVDNTATVALDTKKGFNHAVVSGFYHRMDSPIKVTIPAVTVETKYYIALLNDPANAEMRVKLVVTTELDKTGDREYLTLWEVVRRPNQLLTSANRVKKRPIISPTIIVDSRDSLPPVDAGLWGTRAYIQQESLEVRASYNSWIEISPYRVQLLQPPGWEVKSATHGIQVTPTEGGLHCSLAISPLRRASSYTMGPDFHGLGILIPQGYRPTMNLFSLANQNDAVHEAQLTPEGELLLRARSGPYEIRRDYSFSTNFEWFVPKIY